MTVFVTNAFVTLIVIAKLLRVRKECENKNDSTVKITYVTSNTNDI